MKTTFHLQLSSSSSYFSFSMASAILFLFCFRLKVETSADISHCISDVSENTCSSKDNFLHRYILYDINPYEGFNLRRDVYIRLAVFTKHLEPSDISWHLVLPPWNNLLHWKSKDVGFQNHLPWGLFFDLNELKKFSPVIEMHDFLEEYPNVAIDHVIILQHYNDLLSGNFTWEEKWSVEECQDPGLKFVEKIRDWPVLGYHNISVKNVQCISFHGPASLLKDVLNSFKGRFVLFEHAEISLHDYYGGRDYWECRKSMKFSDSLIKIATDFRQSVLGSLVTENLESQIEEGNPYLSVHLRRRDYVHARPNDVPSIKWTAFQIKKKMKDLNLNTVFVASDAYEEELEDLSQELLPFTMARYKPSSEIKKTFKDGGVAIIEQIICSHARYFIGTYESTFSFRIQEERELMNFHPDTTFNRLCGNDQLTCKQPTRWLKAI